MENSRFSKYKQKLLKKFVYRSCGSTNFFKSTASLRGSLLKNLFIYIFLFVFVFTVLMIPHLNRPETISAEPATLTIILGVACALAVCGLIYVNKDSIVDAAKTFWNGISELSRKGWQSMIEEALAKPDKKMDLTESQFNEAKEFVKDNFTDENGTVDSPPVVDFDVYNSGMASPWEPESLFIYEHAFTLNQTRIIDQWAYDEVMEIAFDTLVWADSNVSADYRFYSLAGNQASYQVWFNGTRNNSWAISGSRFLNVWFDDVFSENTVYYRTGVSSLGILNGSAVPKFILWACPDTNHIAPGVVYQASNGDYTVSPLACYSDGNVYGGAIDYPNKETKDLDVVALPDYIDNLDEYDIVIDGHRYIALADEYGQIIGLYPEQVLNGEWADNVAVGIGEMTGVMEGYYSQYYPYLVYLAKLEKLDSMTFTEAGELVTTGSSTSSLEYDIPETDFDIPGIEILASKFPFCIPFDLYNAIANLEEEPEAPEFNINFPQNIFYAEADMTLNFSIFENLATVIRWIILIGFVIGLIILTRKLIRG